LMICSLAVAFSYALSITSKFKGILDLYRKLNNAVPKVRNLNCSAYGTASFNMLRSRISGTSI